MPGVLPHPGNRSPVDHEGLVIIQGTGAPGKHESYPGFFEKESQANHPHSGILSISRLIQGIITRIEYSHCHAGVFRVA